MPWVAHLRATRNMCALCLSKILRWREDMSNWLILGSYILKIWQFLCMLLSATSETEIMDLMCDDEQLQELKCKHQFLFALPQIESFHSLGYITSSQTQSFHPLSYECISNWVDSFTELYKCTSNWVFSFTELYNFVLQSFRNSGANLLQYQN